MKKIIIPSYTETIGDWMDFVGIEAYTVELSESLWKKTDFLGMIEKAGHGQKKFNGSEMLFKIMCKDGTYYYSYLDYQDEYGEYVYYSQVLGGKYYDDSDIDEGLLRHYETQYNMSRKVIARLCRVATPYLLSDENKSKFVSYIKRYALVGVKEAARFDCPDFLKCLFAYNLIKDDQIDEVKRILLEEKAEDCIANFESIRTTEKISTKKAVKASTKKSVNKAAFLPLSDKDTNGIPGVMVTSGSKINAIDVQLSNGKKYTYFTRYCTSNDDKVIIGTGHISSANIKAEKSKNSGLAGVVVNNTSETSVKKQYAVEIAFSFSDKAESIHLYECVKYLDALGDLKSMNATIIPDRIYPITFLVRKMLAALTVLQFSEFAGGYDSIAREYLNAKHALPQEMLDLIEPCGGSISISDMSSTYLNEYSSSFSATRRDAENGYILYKAGKQGKISKRNELDAFIDHYVLIATAEILMRCHLLHMMKIYLENCEELRKHIEVLITMAKELGAEDFFADFGCY